MQILVQQLLDPAFLLISHVWGGTLALGGNPSNNIVLFTQFEDTTAAGVQVHL